MPLTAYPNTLELRKGVVAMLLPGAAHTVLPGEGRSVNLGVVSMRVLAGGEADTGGAFTLAEFSGTGAGPWTVPHLHRGFEESFFVPARIPTTRALRASRRFRT